MTLMAVYPQIPEHPVKSHTNPRMLTTLNHVQGTSSSYETESAWPGSKAAYRASGLVIEGGDGVLVDARQLEVAAECGPISVTPREAHVQVEGAVCAIGAAHRRQHCSHSPLHDETLECFSMRFANS